jgi:hypothetical protein
MGELETEGLAQLRCVPAGDRHELAGGCVGGQEQRPLETLFYFPHPAEVDQEPAVDPEESLVLQLLLEVIETTGRG